MSKRKKPNRPRKMSDILKEMLDRLFLDPEAAHSTEAAHVALFFANLAWNECTGLGVEREQAKSIWQSVEANNPKLWDELKSRDIDGMIDELVEYKKTHFPDDLRRILFCGGTEHGTVRVEWLQPAAPGVDVRWETQLYGIVLCGQDEESVRFLQRTRNMSAVEARIMITKCATDLGMF